MRALRRAVAASLLCAIAARGAPREAPPSIVRIEMAPEESETRPFTVPTGPEDTLEIDFPWPVDDWAGRGFTPDPERYAGDFVVEATRGKSRVFITAVVAQAHRVLHVVLATDDGRTRSVSIELIPAPAGLAWRRVIFSLPPAPPAGRGRVALLGHPPSALTRAASPESEIGMIRTMRLMLNSTASDADSVASANPSLEFAVQDTRPRSFGDFTLTRRFALRDSTTDVLGLCVSVANTTAKRILFRPDGWVVRAGDRVYPVRTVDFPGELEPGATAAALLLLTPGSDGRPLSLLPDNPFEVSAVIAAAVNPKPVNRYSVEGIEP